MLHKKVIAVYSVTNKNHNAQLLTFRHTGTYIGHTGTYIGHTGTYIGHTGTYIGHTGTYIGHWE